MSTVSGFPLANRREARKLGLLRSKSSEAERERMKPQERNERVCGEEPDTVLMTYPGLFILVAVLMFIAVFPCGDIFSAETGSDMIKQWKRPENLFVLNPQKAAFVVIDMQNFSCAPEGRDPLPRINSVIKQINRLADFCREKGIPVIWVRHNITSAGATDNGGLYSLFHDKGHTKSVMDAGKGTGIYAGMSFDAARDHVVFKNRYSAFLSKPPELQGKIGALKRSQLIFAGIAANVCVESTVRDAMQLDYEVVLVSDGIAAVDDALLEGTLTNTRLFFGDVRTAEEVMRELMRGGS